MAMVNEYYISFTLSGFRQAEAANGGVLQINCSAPARKFKLDKLPGA